MFCTKHSLMDEQSSYLWHRCLGHISKERIQRLLKNEILLDLDFTYLNVCVDCIKDKQTKHTKNKATRSTQLLEIIHIDICGPFDVNYFNQEKYFITFIDNFSHYGLHPGLFAKFLKKHGIYAQYIMPYTPQKYDVSKRHNRTLMDMVKSMYALKTAMYLLNRVPSKAIRKTPFELWTSRKLSLRHLHV